jgi:hypothetical protein
MIDLSVIRSDQIYIDESRLGRRRPSVARSQRFTDGLQQFHVFEDIGSSIALLPSIRLDRAIREECGGASVSVVFGSAHGLVRFNPICFKLLADPFL